MMPRRHIVALVITAAMLPTAAVALTRDEIVAQINALMAELLNVQSQLEALSRPAPRTAAPAAVPCPKLSRTLGIGSRGDDVSQLQRFFASRGLMASGYADGIFDDDTEAAVQTWQSQTGIVHSGSADTTGYGLVGPRTRASLQSTCNGAAASLGYSVGGSNASPYMATLTPTVNTTGSCTRRVFVLDYGDGTVPQQIDTEGVCAPLAKSYPHTYPKPGTYIATLSSGPLQITAAIPIGSGSCDAPTFAIPLSPAPSQSVPFTLGVISYADDATNPMTVEATGTPQGIALVERLLRSTSTPVVTTHVWVLSGTATTVGQNTASISAKNACGRGHATVTLPVAASGAASCPLYPTPQCGARMHVEYLPSTGTCTGVPVCAADPD